MGLTKSSFCKLELNMFFASDTSTWYREVDIDMCFSVINPCFKKCKVVKIALLEIDGLL